jgi:hypothetical protein
VRGLHEQLLARFEHVRDVPGHERRPSHNLLAGPVRHAGRERTRAAPLRVTSVKLSATAEPIEMPADDGLVDPRLLRKMSRSSAKGSMPILFSSPTGRVSPWARASKPASESPPVGETSRTAGSRRRPARAGRRPACPTVSIGF